MTLDDQQVIDSQALIVDIFKGFREELLSAFGSAEFTRKSDASQVTVWDLKVENALSTALLEAFPEIGFQGEETGKKGNEDTYWLVDPIDGTSSFIRGLPFSTNMAALVVDGRVIAAVIYDFVNDYLYTALKGKGAFKDGQPIKVNNDRQPGGLVMYSLTRQKFGHLQEAMDEIGIRLLLPMGAAGHHYVMLAEGKIDGVLVLNSTNGLHDNAPGLLLVEEAGAALLPYDNNEGVFRKEFIVGSPSVIELIEHSGLL